MPTVFKKALHLFILPMSLSSWGMYRFVLLGHVIVWYIGKYKMVAELSSERDRN